MNPVDEPEAEPEALSEELPTDMAVLVVHFQPDGSVRTDSRNVKASQYWAAAGMLRNMGDDLWAQQRMMQMEMMRRAQAENAQVAQLLSAERKRGH